MKYLLLILVTLSSLSCAKLQDFTVSDCISRDCPYGLTKFESNSAGDLVIYYGTGDLCLTKYWGDLKLRNDSLILIATKNSTGAHCSCGYILTYTIRGVDTSNLKIGFEKDYANFVKRTQKKGEKIKYKQQLVTTDKKSEKYNKKMILLVSKAFDKNWKERRKFRNELDYNEKTAKNKKAAKLKPPFDDVYQ